MDDEHQDIIPIDIPKNDIELFLESLELKFNYDYKDYLKMNAKILHDTDKLELNFFITLFEDTELNPFDEEVIFNIEFIENEQPYVQIISNFIRPTMYDIKNYYLCLSSEYHYIFNQSQLAKCQLVLEEMISNIKNFIYYIKDCESLKIYIYFGEYNYGHVYHINDFMRNSNKLDFFRINQVIGEDFYDKILYIICTEINFIVFGPLENNKSLCKILFYIKLSDIEFNFEEIGYCYDKREIKKRLKIIINESKNRNIFNAINYEGNYNNKIKIIKLSSLNDTKNNSINILGKSVFDKDINISKNITQNKNKKRNSQILNSITTNILNEQNASKNKFEFLFFFKDESDENEPLILQNQYLFFKKFLAKKGVLDDIKFDNIILPYRLLFCHPIKDKENKKIILKVKDEIDKLIDLNEKIYEKYKSRKKELEKKRAKKSIKNIIYLCSKISGALFDDNKINNYLDKMRKYATII